MAWILVRVRLIPLEKCPHCGKLRPVQPVNFATVGGGEKYAKGYDRIFAKIPGVNPNYN